MADRFFTDEADDHVRTVLLTAIERRDRAYLTFNVFNARLDFDGGEAVIEDMLDPDLEQSLPLAQFAAQLRGD